MKVLVAKRPSWPRRSGDVWSAMHGEIVVAPFVCPDRGCDCDHVHQGVVSHGFSTEAEVREVDASQEAMVAACRIHLQASQWTAVVQDPSELKLMAADLVDDVRRIAEHYPSGTVLRPTFDHQSAHWVYTPVSR